MTFTVKDRDIPEGATPARIKCRWCGRRNTFADSAVQYGRFRKFRLGHEQARAEMPSCQKCSTKTLGQMRRGRELDAIAPPGG